MNAQENKQLVQEAYQLFLKGDIPGLLARCLDDAEWSSPEMEFVPFSGTFHGKRGIAELLSKLDASTQTLRFEPREFIAEGDKVIVLGEASWLVKATGRRFDTPWIHVITMRDGKMERLAALTHTALADQAFRPEAGAQPSMASELRH